MATSATTQEGAVNCEGPQLQVQGNQVNFFNTFFKTDLGSPNRRDPDEPVRDRQEVHRGVGFGAQKEEIV